MSSLRISALGLVALLAVACGSASNGTDPANDPGSGKPASATENADPRTDEELAAASFCETTGVADVSKLRFNALNPEPRAEYIALRQNQGSVPGPLSEEMTTIAERGQICAGATDPTKCKAAYAKLRPQASPGYQHCFTRGDSVGCIERRSQAIAFLGSVKSLEEAFWLAEYEGYYGQCTYPEVVARGKELADGSFQLAIMKGGGCSEVFRAVINVQRDGTIFELEAKKTDLNLGCP